MATLNRFFLALMSIMLSATVNGAVDPAADGNADEKHEVEQFVSRYEHAIFRRDFSSAASMTYSGLIARMGGQEAAQKEFSRAMQMDVMGPDTGKVRVRRYAEPSGTIFFVEATRYNDSFPKPISFDHLYIVKKTGAAAYEILDLSCISVDWIEGLAPGSSQSPAAKDLIRRGLLSP